jgi:hypothetical protein
MSRKIGQYFADRDFSKRQYVCRACGKTLSFEQLVLMPSSWPDSFYVVCERCWLLSASPTRLLLRLEPPLQPPGTEGA